MIAPVQEDHWVRCVRSLVAILTVPLLFLLTGSQASAQSYDLTVDVLINSTVTAGYNTSSSTPGDYQETVERYLVNLQVPYRVIDVSTSAPPSGLGSEQLIIAAHRQLGLSSAWQSAITSAVSGGTGFVNFDSDVSIGTQAHIQTIFQASGASVGSPQQSVVIPAAMLSTGATPHFIDAMQLKWLNDPAGDITYGFNGGGSAPTASATILTGAKATVIARLGTDPLILATTYGQGRAVDFTTYDYMHPNRIGPAQGVDDIFWRSLVWAARKPFVLRGYPHIASIQMDDNTTGVMSRISDLWDTSITGTVASDGTGGPWNPQLNMQLATLASGTTDRPGLITAMNQGKLRGSPHGLDDGSGGDLYWNLTVANTDAQWLSNVASVQTWQTGQGGADMVPRFSRAMVGHYWDISNNSGYEMYNTLGLRYISTAFEPGVYYWTDPKTTAQRLPFGPFRIYEQQPEYSGDNEETYPYFYADDMTVGSVSGKPAQKFFAFETYIGFGGGRYSRNDATFPSSSNGFSVALSLDQWKYYAWHFWSGMMPVQFYTHDDGNMSLSTSANRRSFVQQFSQWFAANKGQHIFMDQMGDYLRARNHSLLSTATYTAPNVTLNFTGTATDADGNKIATKAWLFTDDSEGSLLSVPGFSNGYTMSSGINPAQISLQPSALTFTTVAGMSPATQTVTVANGGPSGSFTWNASSDATWLTATPASGGSGATATVTVTSTTLSKGTYTGHITFSASGITNSPQTLTVRLTVTPAAAIVPNPASLNFSYVQGATTPAAQTVSLTNPAGTSLAWTAGTSASWLTASTVTAGTPGSLSVAVIPGTLGTGTYTGSVTITPTDTGIATVTIPVTFTITAPVPTFTVSPTSLTFSASSGTGATAAQTLNLASTPASVTWTAGSTATWLTVTPTSGSSTPCSVSVTANASTLSNGTYTATITLTPSTGPVVQAGVTFTIASGQAKLVLSPTSVHLFGATTGPVSVTDSVTNTGTGTMPWTSASDSAWLTPSPASASDAGLLTLTASPTTLSTGDAKGNVAVTATSATGSPATLPVTYHLGSLVFTDTFSAGSSQWTASPLGLASNWSVSGNAFHYNGGGHTQQYAGTSTWSNYIVSATIQLSNLNNYPGGVRGRVNTSTGASYAVWLYPADHVIKLWRATAWDIDTSGLTLLGQSGTIAFDTNPHVVRLQMAGTQLTAYFDDKPVVTVTDSTLAAGAIALDVSSQPIAFSNVSVLQQ